MNEKLHVTAEEKWKKIERVEKHIINLFLKKRIWTNVIMKCYYEDSNLTFYYYNESPSHKIELYTGNDDDHITIHAFVSLIQQNILVLVKQYTYYDEYTLNETEYKKSTYYTE